MLLHWCCVCQPAKTSTGQRMRNRLSTMARCPQVELFMTHKYSTNCSCLCRKDLSESLQTANVTVNPLQVSLGGLAAPPIRPKEPGTPMAKGWASGMNLHTKRGKYFQMTQETPRVRATTSSRWPAEKYKPLPVHSCPWDLKYISYGGGSTEVLEVNVLMALWKLWLQAKVLYSNVYFCKSTQLYQCNSLQLFVKNVVVNSEDFWIK